MSKVSIKDIKNMNYYEQKAILRKQTKNAPDEDPTSLKGKEYMRKVVKVFHPRWEKSVAVKKALERYPDYEVQVHQDIDFDMEKEKEQLLEINQLVILFPMYTYAPPYNYKYWIDSMDYMQQYSHINMWIHATVGGPKDWYQKTEPLTPAEFLKPVERTWTQILRANVLGIRIDHADPKERIGR